MVMPGACIHNIDGGIRSRYLSGASPVQPRLRRRYRCEVRSPRRGGGAALTVREGAPAVQRGQRLQQQAQSAAARQRAVAERPAARGGGEQRGRSLACRTHRTFVHIKIVELNT